MNSQETTAKSSEYVSRTITRCSTQTVFRPSRIHLHTRGMSLIRHLVTMACSGWVTRPKSRHSCSFESIGATSMLTTRATLKMDQTFFAC